VASKKPKNSEMIPPDGHRASPTWSEEMHHTNDAEHRHGHDFDPGNPLGERGTR
jgi:hypothetical protein